jgi:hypothetical protein
VLVTDILTEYKAVLPAPYELLGANLLVLVLLICPTTRESPTQHARATSSCNSAVVCEVWNRVFPPFAGTKGSTACIPFGGNNMGTRWMETWVRDPTIGFIRYALGWWNIRTTFEYSRTLDTPS